MGIKLTLQGFPPFTGGALRFLIAALLLLAFALGKGVSLRIPGGIVWALVVTGLTYFIDYALIYWAELYLSAGVTAVLFAALPLFTAIVSILWLRLESFRAGVWFGLGLGFLGIVLIFLRELRSAEFEGLAIWAGFAVLISAAGAAVSTVIVKKHLRSIDPVALSFYQIGAASLGLLVVMFLAGEGIPTRAPWQAWGAVIYLAVVASALAFSLYYWLLQSLAPTTMSFIVYVTPVMALFIDWWILGETPSINVVAGVALILTGILISELQKYRSHLRIQKARLEP